jgi:peroxiredoxin Q/BCP
MLAPMRRLATVLVAASAAVLWESGTHAAVDLQVGDIAPAFTLPGSDGVTYRLSDYRGKQAVVLAWFAKAFTSG